jgi:hypothetical protein
MTTKTKVKPTVEVLSTPVVTGSFVFVDKPKPDDNGVMKYSSTFIFDPAKMSAKDKERYAAMKAAAKKALRDKFGAEALDSNGNPVNGYKWPFRDAKDLSKHKGFDPGKIFFRCSTERKPSLGKYVVENGNVSVVDVDDTSLFYSGAVLQAKVNVYAYETKGNKGVAFGLRSLAFIRDGERLDGGNADASEAFADGAALAAEELGFEEAAQSDSAGLF